MDKPCLLEEVITAPKMRVIPAVASSSFIWPKYKWVIPALFLVLSLRPSYVLMSDVITTSH